MSQKASGRSPLLQLLRYMKPFQNKFFLDTLFSVLNKLFDLAPPMLIGAAVDVVVKGDESLIAGLGITDPFDQLIWLAGVTAVVWIMESVFQYLFEIYWRDLAQFVQDNLRKDAYSNVQEQEMSFFEDKSRSEEHTSELQSRGHLVCRLLLEKKKENNNHVNS